MKVVFVFPDLNVFSRFSGDYSGIFAHGIGCLSAVLKKNGHETSLLHITKEVNKGQFLKAVESQKPQLIAFSSLSHQFPYVKQWAAWLRENGNIPTICGGVHATVDPDEVINTNGIDMLCRGEGEYALLELCTKMSNNEDISAVKNLWLKRDSRVIKNEVRPLENNLDDLPFADRRLFNYQSLYDYKIRMLTVLASRGCPFNCSYCCNHQYQKLYPHNYVRFRSVDNVLSEIEQALSWYSDVEFINFIDDTLCMDKKLLAEFCEKFPKRFKLPFHGNSRVNFLDEETFSLLKKGGCERLDVGIESGNMHLRQQILKRNISDEQIVETFKLADKFGIKLSAYNMVGCPHETAEMILETIKLNAKVKPYASHNAIFQPYPNTEAYQICVENNFISEKKVSAFFKESVLRQPQITKRQILFFSRFFQIIMKFYMFSFILPQKISEKFTRFIDKAMLGLSRSFIVYKFYFLFLMIFSPIKTAKLLAMKINPDAARKIKYAIYKRHYMKGKS
ncbi:MAG: radical SAM protein [Candidatus Omnitrophica bacterium]|nr:radical SAM protein [Candidatus Omnitrophota bacterium]